MRGRGETPLWRGEVAWARLTLDWGGVHTCGGRCLVHESLFESQGIVVLLDKEAVVIHCHAIHHLCQGLVANVACRSALTDVTG